MTETVKKSVAYAILDEAQGARQSSDEILRMMRTPSADPIDAILGLLQTLVHQQQSILTRLEAIERRIVSLG